jgi:hypothetical protein
MLAFAPLLKTNCGLSSAVCREGLAREWAEYKKADWETFEDFHRDFLRRYWSGGAQMKTFRRITEIAYDPTRGMTMADYFVKRVNQLRALTLPFPEAAVVDTLLKLFPSSIQALWLLLPEQERTIDRAIEVLCQQEEVLPPRQGRAELRPWDNDGRTSRRPTARPTTSTVVQEPSFSPFSIPPPKSTSENFEGRKQVLPYRRA